MDQIHTALLELGVPASLQGFACLHDAVEMAVEDAGVLYSITKQIYPAIAKKHGKTASQVERAMRHAVEDGMLRADPEVMQRYFGGSIDPEKGKPSNREFIAVLALHLRK